jgi:myosin-heavy-chain kinase
MFPFQQRSLQPPRGVSPPQQQPPDLSITVPAIRYVFDLRRKDWVETTTMIRVTDPRRCFETGGMRVCFDVEEIDEGGGATPCVAKFFKKDIPDVVDIDYFNEAMAQCLSEEFAQNFNRSVPSGNARISFLACHVVRIKKEHVPQLTAMQGRNSFFTFKTKDTNDTLFVMEFKFRGKFTKYNNNFGEVYEEGTSKEQLTPQEKESRRKLFLAAEAFSHFTLAESGGSMLVCDLQGVNDFFTDPQIHTEDGKGLGMGNMAQEGIDKWVANHRCNEICAAMRLARLTVGVHPHPVPEQVVRQDSGSAGHYIGIRAAMLSATAQRGVQEAAGPRSRLPPPQAGSPGSPSGKHPSQMTEEEQMELAIQMSLQSR